MESSNLMVFTSEDLKSLTNGFSDVNLIGVTQFGKLYRGFIKPGFTCPEGRHVTVKIWDEKCMDLVSDDEYIMVKEEVEFLSHPTIKGQPNLVKLIGFCCEREVQGVVYDLNSRDTLHNLTLKDDLSWVQRVRIVLQLGCLIEFLHGQNDPHLILNICDSHIVIDWDWSPKLCDFGLINGGTIGEFSALKKKNITMPIGFADPYAASKDGYRHTSSDVFSFGVILLGLISKRVFGPDIHKKPRLVLDNLVHCWAKKEYRPKISLAHESLVEGWGYHPEDGTTITEMGMRCIEFFPANRPAIKTVVEGLQSLMVLRRLGDDRPNKRDKKVHDRDREIFT